MVNRLRESQGADHPQVQRLTSFATRVSKQFALRGVVNLFTGATFSIFLLLVGVDYALLWGVLTFFLSYIPYLGIVLAGAPAVILALAEFGLPQALLVVLGLTVINLSAENVLQPNLMGRGLNIAPAFVFLGFMLWTWLLGAAGAFLAMPMTIMIVLALEAYPETRWLADAVTNEGRVVKSGAALPKAGELKAEE
jgi:predicted PurR-regulated permease PerM